MSGVSVVQALLDEARATYLNDPNKRQFTDVNLLSALKTAYSFLEGEFEKNDLSIKRSTFLKKIPANNNSFGAFPPDFLYPLNLEERTYGSSDGFSPMIQRSVEPIGDPTAVTLLFWGWRDLDDIKFAACSTDREVLLTYLSALPLFNPFNIN